jgi:hypothetical protein
MSEKRLPADSAWSSEPTNIQAFLPTAMALSARSDPLSAAVGRVLGRRPEQDIVDALDVGLHVAGEPVATRKSCRRESPGYGTDLPGDLGRGNLTSYARRLR